jgi:hypothetical protein
MTFLINQDSTLPTLKLEVIDDGRNNYNKIYDNLQNSSITFSMYDVKDGSIRISNAPAEIFLASDQSTGFCERYLIGYKWKERDTKKNGLYKGIFTINFLDGSGILKVPIEDELFISINKTSIKI